MPEPHVQVSVTNREELLAALRAHRATLAERFDVARLAVFGSFARDEATEESDIDLLVEFRGSATAKGFFGVQFYVEDLFGRGVDLTTPDGIREWMLPRVEGEAVDV